MCFPFLRKREEAREEVKLRRERGRAILNKVKMNRELQGHAASLNTEQNTTTLNTRKQPPTS